MQRICPLFELHPERDKDSNTNCGNCVNYNKEEDRNPWQNVCMRHSELLELLATD